MGQMKIESGLIKEKFSMERLEMHFNRYKDDLMLTK